MPRPSELDTLLQDPTLAPEVRDALATLVREGRVSLFSAETLVVEDFDAVDLTGQAPAASGERPRLGRYEDLGRLGEGGMGLVHRVLDPALNRVLAMKIVREELLEKPSSLARFIEEAQATAQLEHPSILPVHELGRLPDGRTYFTMKEVRGRTLTHIIAEVHAHVRHGQWVTTPAGWSLRRMVELVRRVCEAVAHAHARGVLHRDLKPENILVGDWGEVLVADWGLARISGRPDRSALEPQGEATVAPSLDAVRTSRQEASASRTREGMIAGTPVYMAPEQAWGKQDRIGPRTDVYCLGATLWHAVAGTAPYAGNAGEVLRAVREGAPAALVTPAPITEELRQIILTAMARDPEARFSSAAALGRALQDLLDGARRREQALRMVDDAETALPRLGTLRAQAVAYQAEAARLAAAAHTWDPIEVKRPIWELEDQAQRLAEAAADEEIRVVHSLHAALSHTEELPEAHRLLARLYRERHEDAEARGDRAEVRRYEALLRAHDDGTHAAWLQGDGALTLITEPAAAEVTLYRYVERDRKLVPEWAKALGPTPLRAVPLPMGSYLLALHRPGHAEVRYPVRIDRNAHWEGAAPGDRQPAPIPLPTVDELGPDDLFVAPGWFTSGGDAQSGTSASRRRVWVDGFVMRRKLVTNREYLAFLNALVDEGRGEEAARHVPRARAGSADALGAPMYAQDPSGHYRLGADDEGDPWLPEYPVLLVDWHSACAYAAWVSQQTGLPWRLPYEAEWEKAARGVDERVFPWGDALEPTRARMRGGSAGKPLPAEVGSYPDDCGPYGHLDLAGNATEWCADLRATELAVDPNGRALTPRVPPEGPANARRSLRGGNWSYTTASARAAARPDLVANSRTETIGFRLCRPYPR